MRNIVNNNNGSQKPLVKCVWGNSSPVQHSVFSTQKQKSYITRTFAVIVLIVYGMTLGVSCSTKEKTSVHNADTLVTDESSIDSSKLPLTLEPQREMVFVEGGTFLMGSNKGKGNEKPIHQETVGSFWIGKYEITQKLWESITVSYCSLGGEISDRNPAFCVQADQAMDFCNKLSEKEGLQKAYSDKGDRWVCDFNSNGYRLPTEAEWEFAARGGNKSKGYKYSGSDKIEDIAWLNDFYEIGTKQPNELGIYDMIGNIWEWCWDFSGYPSVMRGGSSLYGRLEHPDPRGFDLGLRLVRTK